MELLIERKKKSKLTTVFRFKFCVSDVQCYQLLSLLYFFHAEFKPSEKEETENEFDLYSDASDDHLLK